MTYDWEADAKGCYDEAIRAKRAAWLVENIPGVKRARVIGRCELLEGDCLEIMPHLDRVDAVVTDPPYGIGYGGGIPSVANSTGHANTEVIKWDGQPFDPSPWMQWPCIMWGANHYAERLPHGRWLAWNKLGGKEPWDQFSDVEFAWQNTRAADKIFSHLWKGLCQAGRGEKRSHPTQKPIALMEWCLGFLPNADTILDPFMGSGTTLVACAKLGRKGIGIELDSDYFDIACKRVEEAYLQPDLFVSQPEPQPVQTDLDL